MPLPPPVTSAVLPASGSADTCRSVLQGEGVAWAAADGAIDLGAERLVRLLDEDADLVVVAEREHLGRFLHAERIAFAEIPVHNDAHRLLRREVSVIRLAWSTAGHLAELLALARPGGAALDRGPHRRAALVGVGRLVHDPAYRVFEQHRLGVRVGVARERP